MTYPKPRFSKLKKFVSRSDFGERQRTQISLNFQTSCCDLKIKGLMICVWLFYFFNFERNYDVLKSKRSCILLKEKINFIKNETESKIENITHSFRAMCFSSYKNGESKVKLWWNRARKRKESTFFVTLILFEWNFFSIFVFCHFSVLKNFENIYTCTYQEILLHTL